MNWTLIRCQQCKISFVLIIVTANIRYFYHKSKYKSCNMYRIYSIIIQYNIDVQYIMTVLRMNKLYSCILRVMNIGFAIFTNTNTESYNRRVYFNI